jgi:hypothetical protein
MLRSVQDTHYPPCTCIRMVWRSSMSKQSASSVKSHHVTPKGLGHEAAHLPPRTGRPPTTQWA